MPWLWTSILAFAGLAIGSVVASVGAIGVAGRRLDARTALLVPVGVLVAVVVATVSETGLGVTKYARVATNAGTLAAAVPLAGAAWVRRSFTLGAICLGVAAGGYLLSIGSGISLLPTLSTLVLFGIPGFYLGIWAGAR